MTLSVKDLLAGDSRAIGALLEGADDGWGPWIQHVLDGGSPAPEFVKALWKAHPRDWLRRAEQGFESLPRSAFMGGVADNGRPAAPPQFVRGATPSCRSR